MPNENYKRGRRVEYLVCNILEKAGYDAQRVAGSHGHYDVIAINSKSIRLVQVKLNQPITPAEREAFQDFLVPEFATKEIWFRKTGQREWKIEVL